MREVREREIGSERGGRMGEGEREGGREVREGGGRREMREGGREVREGGREREGRWAKTCRYNHHVLGTMYTSLYWPLTTCTQISNR